MKMHDVFISYSSIESREAEQVRDILELNGIVCWMAPRDIKPGENYAKVIPKAIRDCKVFVLILSENAQSSKFVPKELDNAVTAGKLILPFMLEDCPLNDEFNFLLTGAQRFSAYQQIITVMEALVKQIWGIIGINDDKEILLPVDDTEFQNLLKEKTKKKKDKRIKPKTKRILVVVLVIAFLIGFIPAVSAIEQWILKDEQRYSDERAQTAAIYYAEEFLRTSDYIRKTVCSAINSAREALFSYAGDVSSTQNFDIDPYREDLYNNIFLMEYLISSSDAEYIYKSAYDPEYAIEVHKNLKSFYADAKILLSGIDDIVRVSNDFTVEQKLMILECTEEFVDSVTELIALQTNWFLLPLDPEVRQTKIFDQVLSELEGYPLDESNWSEDSELLLDKINQCVISTNQLQQLLGNNEAIFESAGTEGK